MSEPRTPAQKTHNALIAMAMIAHASAMIARVNGETEDQTVYARLRDNCFKRAGMPTYGEITDDMMEPDALPSD